MLRVGSLRPTAAIALAAGAVLIALTGCGGGGARQQVSPATFVGEHPIFSLDPGDPAKLVLKKGDYEIDETVVVPAVAALTIEPGTVLRFAADQSLLSYAPIIARGTQDAPILFAAETPGRAWGIVAVLTKDRSVFEHVRFADGSSATVDGKEIPGGLSLVGTQVSITDSEFGNMHGKDAVYVNHGQVVIHDNLFHNTTKDCLDLDGGSGVIQDNEFRDCGDDGIDLSDNGGVSVFGNTVVVSTGNGIAADENLDQILAKNTVQNGGS